MSPQLPGRYLRQRALRPTPAEQAALALWLVFVGAAFGWSFIRIAGWIVYGLTTEQWGLAVTECAFFASYVAIIREWSR